MITLLNQTGYEKAEPVRQTLPTSKGVTWEAFSSCSVHLNRGFSNKININLQKSFFFAKPHTKRFLVIFLGVMLFFTSCPSSEQNNQTTNTGGNNTMCSTDSNCPVLCKTIFETSKKLYDKCLQETSINVAELSKAILAMDKGSWKSIKAESLQALVNFDTDIWPKYAGVQNKTTIQEMLLWVAEEESIANHVYQEVLKKAFTVLGSPAEKTKVVQEGMKENVDTKENRSFLEVSVFNKNKKAFEQAHKLLIEDCEESRFCVQKFYCCLLNKTLVFQKLNEYDLAKDANKSGSFYQSDCDNYDDERCN